MENEYSKMSERRGWEENEYGIGDDGDCQELYHGALYFTGKGYQEGTYPFGLRRCISEAENIFLR